METVNSNVFTILFSVSGGRSLQKSDIDSDRLFLHVRGKGSKDRYVPRPNRTLELLRQLWQTHHSETWFVPAQDEAAKANPQPNTERHGASQLTLTNLVLKGLYE